MDFEAFDFRHFSRFQKASYEKLFVNVSRDSSPPYMTQLSFDTMLAVDHRNNLVEAEVADLVINSLPGKCYTVGENYSYEYNEFDYNKLEPAQRLTETEFENMDQYASWGVGAADVGVDFSNPNAF